MIQEEKEQEWSVVKIRSALINSVKDFLQTKQAKELGYTNPTQFVDAVVRDLLKQYSSQEVPIRFVLPSLDDDELRIDVHIFSDKIKCNRCIENQESCKHVDLIYDNKEVKSHLKKAKVVIPKRK